MPRFGISQILPPVLLALLNLMLICNRYCTYAVMEIKVVLVAILQNDSLLLAIAVIVARLPNFYLSNLHSTYKVYTRTDVNETQTRALV